MFLWKRARERCRGWEGEGSEPGSGGGHGWGGGEKHQSEQNEHLGELLLVCIPVHPSTQSGRQAPRGHPSGKRTRILGCNRSATRCSLDQGQFPDIFVPQFPHRHNEDDDTVFRVAVGLRGTLKLPHTPKTGRTGTQQLSPLPTSLQGGRCRAFAPGPSRPSLQQGRFCQHSISEQNTAPPGHSMASLSRRPLPEEEEVYFICI